MPLSDFFLDRVTEEIRVQLEGVLALTDRLSRQHLNADAQACVDGVDEAATAVCRLLAATQDLKTAAEQRLSLKPEPRLLRDLMDEVQERWISRARESGVTLLVSYEGDPAAAALVDPHRLHQVFDGFIGQAISSVHRGAVEASLRVSAQSGEALRLEGRVRGAGEVMHQGLSGSIEDIDARFGLETAIGAALAQNILASLDGAQHTESNAGGGETAVFVLDAPCAPKAEAAQPESAADRAAHILIVDDNATNRMVAETLCEMFDCTAETAVDGVEAVELARTGRF
ncbi:MAG: hybrid sensor histidine kinase/response regulator, partial [Phenylobacterium sp.]|nr:hybrid sensor histidine kinase/response regulator [Phenylobacterium sp.]